MKKILVSLLFIIVLSLTACNNKKDKITVLVPNGTPAIAQSKMEYEMDSSNYQIERVSGPSPLIAAITSKSHDIIIAPLNIGANLYNKDAKYQLAGVLTWNNLQIISRSEINLDNFTYSTILAFGEGAIPEMIISYLLADYNPPAIDYSASSAQESFLAFMQNENSMAIVSEPVTTIAKTEIEGLYVYDLSDLWTEKTSLEKFPQAGVFVKEDLDIEVVEKYLTTLKSAALFTVLNPEETSSFCEELDSPFEKEVIKAAIPLSYISFHNADESIVEIEYFFNMILDFKGELIGDKLPDENFYWSRP